MHMLCVSDQQDYIHTCCDGVASRTTCTCCVCLTNKTTYTHIVRVSGRTSEGVVMDDIDIYCEGLGQDL